MEETTTPLSNYLLQVPVAEQFQCSLGEQLLGALGWINATVVASFQHPLNCCCCCCRPGEHAWSQLGNNCPGNHSCCCCCCCNCCCPTESATKSLINRLLGRLINQPDIRRRMQMATLATLATRLHLNADPIPMRNWLTLRNLWTGNQLISSYTAYTALHRLHRLVRCAYHLSIGHPGTPNWSNGDPNGS